MSSGSASRKIKERHAGGLRPGVKRTTRCPITQSFGSSQTAINVSVQLGSHHASEVCHQHSERIRGSVHTKSRLPKVRQGALITNITKGLHMMSSQKSPKASAISYYKTDDNGVHEISIHLADMREKWRWRWSTHCSEGRQTQPGTPEEGIPLPLICSLSIFSPVSLPPAFSPLSSHHSKMLPGPVLAAMVTKTRGIVTWASLPGSRLVGFRESEEGGLEPVEGGGVMSHAHRFPDGRDPHSGRLRAKTDTIGVF